MCEGLRVSDKKTNCVQAATPLPLQYFVVNLRERSRAVRMKLDGAAQCGRP